LHPSGDQSEFERGAVTVIDDRLLCAEEADLLDVVVDIELMRGQPGDELARIGRLRRRLFIVGGALHAETHGASLLLDRVRDLMREQRSPALGSRRVIAIPERDVPSIRIGPSAGLPRTLSCTRIRMDADIGQVAPKARLKKRATPRIEWLAGRAENLAYDA